MAVSEDVLGGGAGATAEQDSPDYPVIFHGYVRRSLHAALALLSSDGYSQLSDDERERALHALSFGLGDPESWGMANELLQRLALPLEIQGYRSDWMEFLARGLEQARRQDDRQAEGRLLVFLGRLTILLDDMTAARELLEQARAVSAACGDTATQALAMQRLGYAAYMQTDLVRARQLSDDALALLAEDDPQRANSYHNLAWIAQREARPDLAVAYLQAAVALRERQGIPYYMGQAYRDLGSAYFQAQNYTQALESMERALALFTVAGDRLQETITTMNKGLAYWGLGRYEEALACLDRAEPLAHQFASRNTVGEIYNNRGLVYLEQGRFAEAEAALTTALGVTEAVGTVSLTVDVLDSLASLYLRTGELEKAGAALHDAEAALQRLPVRARNLDQLLAETRKRWEAAGGGRKA